MKKSQRTEESKKRSKFLFILIILTLILSITATYAWFSVQRNVEVSNLQIEVGVAEGLQISLDGEEWTQTILIEDMLQLVGKYTEETEDEDTGEKTTTLVTVAKDGETPIYQAKADDNRNTLVVNDGKAGIGFELLPVSTVGELSSGDLQFVTGEIHLNQLSDITLCSEEDIGTEEENYKNHPYLAFDIYLRNVSPTESITDELYLNTGSECTPKVEDTGLESSVRVGLVVYNNTASLTETDTSVIRALAGSDDGTDQVAIWEPNYLSHTAYIVAEDSRITAESQDFTTLGIKAAIAGDVNVATSSNVIADITDETDENLVAVYTNRFDMEDYKTISAAGDLLKTIDEEALVIESNKISKARVYIWLEGQDPDCLDVASSGKQLTISLKLMKKEVVTGSEATNP